MKCLKCGYDNPDNIQVCVNCLTPLNSATPVSPNAQEIKPNANQSVNNSSNLMNSQSVNNSSNLMNSQKSNNLNNSQISNNIHQPNVTNSSNIYNETNSQFSNNVGTVNLNKEIQKSSINENNANINQNTSLENNKDINREKLIEDFVGANYPKVYIKNFNWSACLLGILYFFYRKMYLNGIIIAVILFILQNVILKSIFSNIIFNLLFYVALCACYGFIFKGLYQKHVNNKIDDIIAMNPKDDFNDLRVKVARKGGTNLAAPFAYIPIMIFISFVFAIGTFVSQIQSILNNQDDSSIDSEMDYNIDTTDDNYKDDYYYSYDNEYYYN